MRIYMVRRREGRKACPSGPTLTAAVEDVRTAGRRRPFPTFLGRSGTLPAAPDDMAIRYCARFRTTELRSLICSPQARQRNRR
jgi:hypothetical protein